MSQIKGYKQTEETKIKISESGKKAKHDYWLGKKRVFKNPEERNKKISENNSRYKIGKKFPSPSKETRIKLSESLKGEKNPNYKGGINPTNDTIRKGIEFRLWREAIFARDNWTCQKCKAKGGYLHPHHIFNFATHLDLRFAIDNGITLCKECHKQFHKKYGYQNNTEEQLIEFLNN